MSAADSAVDPADSPHNTARLICVGNVVIDLLASVPQLPERGGDVIAQSRGFAPGGAFNVMVAAARQGLPADYAGAHGVGAFGELARAAMAAEGIQVLLEPTVECDTGYDIALTEAGGERTFVTVVGAEATLTSQRLRGVTVGASDIVYVSGYGLLREPNASAIAQWLESIPNSACVLVDPGPLGGDIRPDIARRIRQRADWWSCNEREALRAIGAADADRAVAARGADVLAAFTPRRGVVLRLGAQGCLLLSVGQRPRLVPGFTVAAVDTNGAGDAHVGAFLAALARGLAPGAAARHANAAAAIAVTRRGPATAPTRGEVDAFLAGST
ncbi:MAG: PfkB family carbohydrate kinase [Microbacteriaceae bacterium]